MSQAKSMLNSECRQLVNYPINSISIRDMDLIVCSTPTNAMARYILVPLFMS